MPHKKKSKKKYLFKRLIFFFFLLIIICCCIIGYKLYNIIYKPNVFLKDKQTTYLFIHSNSNFDNLINNLKEEDILINTNSFKWLAKKRDYTKIYPGKYLIKANMSNNELISLLRSGKQEPVRLIFNNIRTKQQLVSRIAKQIEADSLSLISLLNDSEYLHKFNLSPENSIVLFIPNTYEFYWNTSAKQFVERMYREYNNFWNRERIEKAKKMNLTPVNISILASIVLQETRKTDEMSRIAGVYINRLNKNMLLQADPSVIFAIGDFTINRVLKKHLTIDSPYNTYKYTGLPPGPICLPTSTSIDRVLNYEKHKFLYFCAKEDFSGYHNFAKTLRQHLINARKYQKKLRKLKKNKLKK